MSDKKRSSKPSGTSGGTVTRKGRNFLPRPLPSDDEIFSLGYVIGGIRQTGIVRRTYGAYHDQSDTATITFGYRREPSDD